VTGWAGACRVAVDSLGRTLVSDSHPHYGKVFVLDARGNFTRAWFGGMGRIIAVRTNDKDRIVVANHYGNRVHVLDYEGNEKLALGTGRPGVGNGEFNGPEGVCFDTQGNIYAADSGNNRIQVFAPDGKLIRTISQMPQPTPGEPPAVPLRKPTAVAVDRGGRVLVADAGNKRIAIFDKAGKFAGAIEGFKDVSDLTIDDAGNLIVADSAAQRVKVFSPQGALRAEYGGAPNAPVLPLAVAVGLKGEIVYIDRVINGLRTIGPEEREASER